jgi:hypothetical protein
MVRSATERGPFGRYLALRVSTTLGDVSDPYTAGPDQQPPAAHSQQPPDRRRMATRKLLAIIGASTLGLCCVASVIVDLIIGPQPSKPAGHKAPVAAAPTTTAATPVAPTRPTTGPTRKPSLPPTAKAAEPTQGAEPEVANPATPPDREICRVTDNGGSYYLLVTSATYHNFQACDGATPYDGTMDKLLNLPKMGRRCILGDQYTADNHALVGVYSDTDSANMAAARRFCDANGG